MQIFQIEQIELAPLTIIAEDSDHAAEIFLASLLMGFAFPPKVNFDVTAWNLLPGPAKEWFEAIASKGNCGIVWLTDDVAPQMQTIPVIPKTVLRRED